MIPLFDCFALLVRPRAKLTSIDLICVSNKPLVKTDGYVCGKPVCARANGSYGETVWDNAPKVDRSTLSFH